MNNGAPENPSCIIDPLFEVLDAIAFVDSPTTKSIAQYANIDARTAGKLLKNARLIGLVQSPDDETYVLAQPYPYKGTLDEKRKVVREALLKLPLIRNFRQFMALGNNLEDAMRKAATVAGENHYDTTAIAPVVSSATNAQVLELNVRVEKRIGAGAPGRSALGVALDTKAAMRPCPPHRPTPRRLASPRASHGATRAPCFTLRTLLVYRLVTGVQL